MNSKVNGLDINLIFFFFSFSDEIKEVTVPAFADSISEGDVRWDKKPGDQVKEDDVLCEIETDKVCKPKN